MEREGHPIRIKNEIIIAKKVLYISIYLPFEEITVPVCRRGQGTPYSKYFIL